MASLHARQRDPLLDQNTAAMLERRGHELIGIGLLVLAILFTLILGSYSPEDPGWMVATEEPAQNTLGRFGAAIASTLMIIGGKGAWMIPIILAAWAVRFITHRGAERALSRVVFAVIAVALTSVFFATLVPGAGWSHAFGLGGLFGDTILGTMLGVAPVNAGIGLTLFSIILGAGVLAIGLWVTGFSMPELRMIRDVTTLLAVRGYDMAMATAGRGTAAASGALAERRANRAQAQRLQQSRPAQPQRRPVTRAETASLYNDPTLSGDWQPEPLAPPARAKAPMAATQAQPHPSQPRQAQAQAQAQPAQGQGQGRGAAIIHRQPQAAPDDLVAPLGEWGRPDALNTTLRADPRYPEPMAEAAHYAPPREKLGLLARVPHLMRRSAEPEPELFEPELPDYDEEFLAPDEDRIKSRISDAIRARMRHPGPTLNPNTAMPGLRREPPVVSPPRSLTARLRGPQPLLADTGRRPIPTRQTMQAAPNRPAAAAPTSRNAEPPMTAAQSLMQTAAQAAVKTAAHTAAGQAANVVSTLPPAPPLPPAYAAQAQLHRPVKHDWTATQEPEDIWGAEDAADYDYGDEAFDDGFETQAQAAAAAPFAAPIVPSRAPSPALSATRAEPVMVAPRMAPPSMPLQEAQAPAAAAATARPVLHQAAPAAMAPSKAAPVYADYDDAEESDEDNVNAFVGYDEVDDQAEVFEDDYAADDWVEPAPRNAFAPAPPVAPAAPMAQPAPRVSAAHMAPVAPRAPLAAPSLALAARPMANGMINTRPMSMMPSPMGQPQRRSFDEQMSHPYELPPLALLSSASAIERHSLSDEALEENARMLESVLDDYGVKGEIVSVRPGPVVTMYELEPAPGLKASRVIGLADDIARSMSALSARVSTVPGRSVIGIELPNVTREKVVLREILAARDFGDSNLRLPLALGKDIGGDPIVANLAKMPHLLIAGTTGSGKSVAINTMILSLLYKLTPEECRLIMIDPKMLELSVYDGIPHLLSPVVTDPKKAVVALKWVVSEMEERYRKMSKMGVRNIEGYNGRVREALAKAEMFKRTIQTGFDEDTGEPVFETEEFAPVALPYIVVIVDEMADLMMVAGKEIEACIQRLAQMARASGIHLIMATQRPSVDVITGTIKANFPTRISFQVTSKIDSRTILGEQGAEQLLGMGDMLYMGNGQKITRIHGPFVSDEEVEEVVNHLKSFGPPVYMSGVVEGPDEDVASDIDQVLGLNSGNGDGEDALYDQAVAIVARDRKCSTSYIQRKLGIGYNKAARLVEQMEDEGVVTAANHVGKREILIPEH